MFPDVSRLLVKSTVLPVLVLLSTASFNSLHMISIYVILGLWRQQALILRRMMLCACFFHIAARGLHDFCCAE